MHAYLQRSLACLKDVEVVLDRRAVAVPPAADRRRRPAEVRERQLLICSLVHCPVEPAVPAPPLSTSPPDTRHRRTLLWPDLDHL